MNAYIAYGFNALTAIIAVIMIQFKRMSLILIGQITANLLTALSYFLSADGRGRVSVLLQ